MITFPCQAVLFDCDGVLVDSDAAVVDAWTRWATDLGFAPADVLAGVHGQRSADTVAQWLEPARQEAELARIDRYEVESAAGIRAIPGAVDLASAMPTGRWAVVTSGIAALATARLRAAGIPIPSVLVCADDVQRGKPDPEGYLTAARGLGVEPPDTIVLEDAPAGIAAARAAGVGAVIGIGDRAREVEIDGWAQDLRAVQWSVDGLRLGP